MAVFNIVLKFVFSNCKVQLLCINIYTKTYTQLNIFNTIKTKKNQNKLIFVPTICSHQL